MKPLSRGYALLSIVGILAIVTTSVMALMVISTLASSQGNVTLTAKNLERARSIVLDYVRQNQVLPSIAQFESLTAGLTDAWGRKFLYFPSSNLLVGTIGNAAVTSISISQCGDDVTCSTPSLISNIPFLLVSGGDVINTTADVAGQTTSLTASTAISTATTFKQYKTGLNVGLYATPDVLIAKPYDDQLGFAVLPEIQSAAQSLTQTQGNTLDSGGTLKILNTSLPSVSVGCGYSKTLTAYGREGAFSWSIQGLPSGLIATTGMSPVDTRQTMVSTISGFPTSAGTYSVTATVTDSAGRSYTHPNYSLVVLPALYDTTPPQTQTLACGTNYSGAISQSMQTSSCGTPQWITTSNTCTPISATTNVRFTNTTVGAVVSGGSTNTGVNSLTIGAGTTASVTVSTGTAANISRSGTGGTQALGVIGGNSTSLDAGELLNFQFNGGFGRNLGIEFRALTGSESATIQYVDSTTSSTVATQTVSLSGCTNPSYVAPTGNNSVAFRKLGLVTLPFDKVVVTANSPASTAFFIRGIRTCDAATTVCPSSGATNFCDGP